MVAELLRTHKGELELVEAREFLPKFKTRKGMSQWFVLDDYFAQKRERKEKKTANQTESEVKKSENIMDEENQSKDLGDSPAQESQNPSIESGIASLLYFHQIPSSPATRL